MCAQEPELVSSDITHNMSQQKEDTPIDISPEDLAKLVSIDDHVRSTLLICQHLLRAFEAKENVSGTIKWAEGFIAWAVPHWETKSMDTHVHLVADDIAALTNAVAKAKAEEPVVCI